MKPYKGQAKRDKADISKMELRLGKARRFWKGIARACPPSPAVARQRQPAPTYFITARARARPSARLKGRREVVIS